MPTPEANVQASGSNDSIQTGKGQATLEQTVAQLEQRVAALEAEIENIKAELRTTTLQATSYAPDASVIPGP